LASRRLGIFGGTFDPPHHGHLIVAGEALEVLGLDQVLLVPAADPPHKSGRVEATADQRLRMLAAAVGDDPRFRVEAVEIERGGTSYTVDTLLELRRAEPEVEWALLIGLDQFRSFAGWRDPEGIARLARLGVLSRGGEELREPAAFGAVRVPVSRIDISATEVRRRAAAGLSLRYYVPDAVAEIIAAEGLYRLSE
jgi:nicotinate-nucleotide adenylyltransferase